MGGGRAGRSGIPSSTLGDGSGARGDGTGLVGPASAGGGASGSMVSPLSGSVAGRPAVGSSFGSTGLFTGRGQAVRANKIPPVSMKDIRRLEGGTDMGVQLLGCTGRAVRPSAAVGRL